MHRGDLLRVGRDRRTRRRPYHDRRDEIAGTGRIIVEQTQHILRPNFEAEFLLEFAPRRLDRYLALVAAPAGQRPLTAVDAQGRRAQRQQQRRSISGIAGLDQCDGDRGPLQRRRRLAFRQPRKAGAGACNIPPGGIVEWPGHPA
jgi:hypothetical protein